MAIRSPLVLLAGLCLAGTTLAAKVPLYDDFSGPGIDRSKWNEAETWRYVDDKGRLTMGRYIFGATTSDSGVTLDNLNLSVSEPTSAKTLKATITVTAVNVDETCAANTSVSSSYARLTGSYFNVRSGGPLPGDRTGDVGAQIRVIRSSNSSDAAGVLKVQGVPFVCTNADCSTSSAYGAPADLGLVNVGTAVTAQINWDKKNNKFAFIRDNGTPVEVSYTDSDSTAPELAYNNISLRNVVANCQSGPRVKAGIEARFDNVGIAP
jgi:hypothetical protein